MLRYTASSAAFCSSSSRASARITDSTEPCPPSVSVRAVPAAWSSSPASARRVSADTLRASASARRTRTDGWCSPRSIWLRYGLERLVRSASWRSDRLASLRWLRMNAPRAFIWASHGSTMPHLAPGSVVAVAPPQPWVSLTRSAIAPAPGLAYAAPSVAKYTEHHAARRPGYGQPRGEGGKSGGLGRGGRLLGRRLGAEQRRGRLEHVLGELPLGRGKLLGEVVRTRH